MFGVDAGSGTTLEKFANTLASDPDRDQRPDAGRLHRRPRRRSSGLGRVNKAIPGALIAVVGAIAASYFLDLAADGVTTLGTVPGGLPSLGLPTEVMTTANIAALLPTVISMFVVILAQSAATSRAYAMKYNDSFDENVDLVGLGAANFAAGHQWHVRGQRQPDQDRDGRQRRRPQPGLAADRRARSSSWSCCS